MDERQLLEKLALIEALHAGAATPGERDAAAAARDRIRARLNQFQAEETPVEYSFKVADHWSYRLLVALLRRYQIHPYRYPRQRRTTVMARVPPRFVDEVLWPEFKELNRVLRQYLADVTERVIAQGLEPDASDVEERREPQSLPEKTWEV
ncbi:MAG: hypothetical protein JNL97_11825 [Verrucomicrobiales bacterium]|nr:hypothetical protein [Verrucomicrobiales bacterium]